MNVVGLMGILAVAWTGQAAANGSVVISNLAQAAVGTSGTDYRFGQGVVAGSTVDVNSITVSLENEEEFEDPSTELLIRNSSSGGTVLFSFPAQNIPVTSAPANYTFTAPANTILNAGTTYYIALSDSTGQDFATPFWAYNTSGGTGDAGWSIPASFNNPSTGRHMLSIDATVIPTPEPGVAAIILGISGLALQRRRQRRGL